MWPTGTTSRLPWSLRSVYACGRHATAAVYRISGHECRAAQHCARPTDCDVQMTPSVALVTVDVTPSSLGCARYERAVGSAQSPTRAYSTLCDVPGCDSPVAAQSPCWAALTRREIHEHALQFGFRVRNEPAWLSRVGMGSHQLFAHALRSRLAYTRRARDGGRMWCPSVLSRPSRMRHVLRPIPHNERRIAIEVNVD